MPRTVGGGSRRTTLFSLILVVLTLTVLGAPGISGAATVSPDNVEPRWADGFSIESYQGLDLVTVHRPAQGAEEPVRYLLLPRGVEDPGGVEDAARVTVPVRRMVTLTTSQLPHLELIGELDSLRGVASIDHVSSPAVRRAFDQGRVTEVGSADNLDLEKLLTLAPDVVFTDAGTLTLFQGHSALREAGIPVVVSAEFLEGNILGRTEWLLFTSLFFDREVEAELELTGIADRYEAIARRAAAVEPSERPTVFGGSLWGDAWHVAGGRSFPAELFAAAGARYLWADEPVQGSIPLDFEAVFARAATARFWLPSRNGWRSLSDAIAEDGRYELFAAVKAGRVYNFNGRVNDSGGNDYWERGLVQPDVVLADLVRVFHPELLPDHRLVYLRHLE